MAHYFSMCITNGALFKRGHYSREREREHYFFNAGTFTSSSIKTKKAKKTEPNVFCKLSRLHRKGNRNCDLDPETTSSMTWTRTLPKEHLTFTCSWLQDGGGGGGGNYSREGHICSLALRDWGTIQERALIAQVQYSFSCNITRCNTFISEFFLIRKKM